MPILLKLFQKFEEKGTLPNSFYENTIIIISKPDKYPKKKLQVNIFDKYRCKNTQEDISRDLPGGSVVGIQLPMKGKTGLIPGAGRFHMLWSD